MAIVLNRNKFRIFNFWFKDAITYSIASNDETIDHLENLFET